MNLALDLEEDIPTRETCDECKGEGVIREETPTSYKVSSCKWCKGEGRRPISGTVNISRMKK